MSVYIPIAMHKALLGLQDPTAPGYADKVTGFITFLSYAARGNLKKEAEEALQDIMVFVQERDRLQGLLMYMFEQCVYIQAPDAIEGQVPGYHLRVGETLLDTMICEVFELDGVVSVLRSSGPSWQQQCVLEYFNRCDIWELLHAIECRLTIPMRMYTGLDTRGNNGTHDKA